LQAIDEMRGLIPANSSMAQFVLRWVLMVETVSCVIPGAKNAIQVQDNAAVANLPLLSDIIITEVYSIL